MSDMSSLCEELDLLRQNLIYDVKPNGKLLFFPSSYTPYPKAEAFEQQFINKMHEFRIPFSEVIHINYHDESLDYKSLISEATFIYLHGGNPLEFMRILNELGITPLLKEYQEVMMGLSAGAMLLSEYIVLTPCSLEYPDFVMIKGLGRSTLNIYPHINVDDIMVTEIETVDGIVKAQDIRYLSQYCTIQCLSDKQIIRTTDDQIDWIGDCFFQFSNQILQRKLEYGYQDCYLFDEPLLKPHTTQIITRQYDNMECAQSDGYFHRLLNGLDQSIFMITLNTEQKGICYAQCISYEAKSWVIIHPQMAYLTLSLIKTDDGVIEKLEFEAKDGSQRWLGYLETLVQ